MKKFAWSATADRSLGLFYNQKVVSFRDLIAESTSQHLLNHGPCAPQKSQCDPIP